MEIKFYSEIEYRKYIRTLSDTVDFRTISKPFELPIILVVQGENNSYENSDSVR